MRIDLNLSIGQTPDSGKPGKPDLPSGAGSKTSDLAADVANPSADYVRAQALAATLSQLPEVRQEKVAALAEMVRSGNYAVTPEQTSEALLAHMAGSAAA
ncbi:MAG TPA: flagellar biosynthesis anti-sigma factor FlgM [Terriglobales bacterium]|nr:flagellar biosynthesis anti-sigma factor FlgM [Terriglobales bacterium]